MIVKGKQKKKNLQSLNSFIQFFFFRETTVGEIKHKVGKIMKLLSDNFV